MYWADIYPTDRRTELEEALSIGRELEDQWNIATALRNLGLLENIQGNYPQARAFLEQSLEAWGAMGPDGRMGYAHALIYLGDVAIIEDNRDSARAIFEEAAEVLREAGDLNFRAYSVRRLGQLLWREGNYAAATSLCKESLSLNLEVGDPRGVMASLAGFAAIAAARGELERAAEIMAAVEAQLAAIGVPLLHVDRLEYERNLARLRTEVDEQTLAELWEKGARMLLDEAIAFGLRGS
jgi:tetratricopeptide (TPR) repeat protein